MQSLVFQKKKAKWLQHYYNKYFPFLLKFLNKVFTNVAQFHAYRFKCKVNEKVCTTCASKKKVYKKVYQKMTRNNLSLLILDDIDSNFLKQVPYQEQTLGVKIENTEWENSWLTVSYFTFHGIFNAGSVPVPVLFPFVVSNFDACLAWTKPYARWRRIYRKGASLLWGI